MLTVFPMSFSSAVTMGTHRTIDNSRMPIAKVKYDS
jgi:hypothetical protein